MAKEFAGLVAWVASVVKSMRPYSRMIWAAALSKPAGQETWASLYTQRLRLPLIWLLAAAKKQLGIFHRFFPLKSPTGELVLTFDASLTAGGATMSRYDGDKEVVVGYMRTQWTTEDMVALNANCKDPAHQVAWEAYMLLVALCTWTSYLTEGRALRIRGDAQGVLQGVIRGQAKSASINLLIAEIQLVLAPVNYDLTAIHWSSDHNVVCDDLSRPERPMPAVLQCVKEDRVYRRHWHFLRSEAIRDLGYA